MFIGIVIGIALCVGLFLVYLYLERNAKFFPKSNFLKCVLRYNYCFQNDYKRIDEWRNVIVETLRTDPNKMDIFIGNIFSDPVRLHINFKSALEESVAKMELGKINAIYSLCIEENFKASAEAVKKIAEEIIKCTYDKGWFYKRYNEEFMVDVILPTVKQKLSYDLSISYLLNLKPTGHGAIDALIDERVMEILRSDKEKYPAHLADIYFQLEANSPAENFCLQKIEHELNQVSAHVQAIAWLSEARKYFTDDSSKTLKLVNLVLEKVIPTLDKDEIVIWASEFIANKHQMLNGFLSDRIGELYADAFVQELIHLYEKFKKSDMTTMKDIFDNLLTCHIVGIADIDLIIRTWKLIPNYSQTYYRLTDTIRNHWINGKIKIEKV